MSDLNIRIDEAFPNEALRVSVEGDVVTVTLSPTVNPNVLLVLQEEIQDAVAEALDVAGQTE